MSVWVKPHIVLMATTVWLLTAWRLASGEPRARRTVCLDLLGSLLGGVVAAIPGVSLWLIVYNAWEPFLDVFLGWNPFYTILAQASSRSHQQRTLLVPAVESGRAGDELRWHSFQSSTCGLGRSAQTNRANPAPWATCCLTGSGTNKPTPGRGLFAACSAGCTSCG